MSRDEVFRASGPTSGSKVRVKLGAKRDGTVIAASVSLWYEAGAYRGSPAGAGAMCALAPYRIPNFFIEAYDVVVNKPKVAAYRAPGSPMALFATDSAMDDLARALRLDPIELRLKNAAVEGDRAPYGPVYGPIGLHQVLEAARKHPHWKAPLGPNQGRGVACGFWFNAGLQSSAPGQRNLDGASVTWERGRAMPPAGGNGDGARQPLTVVELAAQMPHTGGPIVGRASLNAPMAGPAFGAHICDLEVDMETGRSTVVRYTAIQDAGKAVHPSFVEGQMQGGAAQGIGWALNEEYVFNADGVMENAG